MTMFVVVFSSFFCSMREFSPFRIDFTDGVAVWASLVPARNDKNGGSIFIF